MRRFTGWKIRTLLIALTFCAPLAAHAELTPEQVRRAIARAIDYFKHEQKGDGSFPVGGVHLADYSGGSTTLATLALLTAGVPPTDPQVKQALIYLRSKVPQKRTYVVSLQTMALCAAGSKTDLGLIRSNVKWLEKAQQHDGRWGYEMAGENRDLSNTQFALLAMHEAERFSDTIRVSDEVWKRALAFHLNHQYPDGSWGYSSSLRSGGYGSMTCAGIASVIICSQRLRDQVKLNQGQLQCCGQMDEAGLAERSDAAVKKGLQWLARHFSVKRHPNIPSDDRQWLYYYLYSLERVGRLSARRHIAFGGKSYDWYREGTEQLVRTQKVEGHWKGTGVGEDSKLIATSFALLFLAKGSRPLLVGKVKHGTGNDWNNHPDDVANLTAHVEKVWERDLTWQVVDVETASVEELLQIPVLFLSGRDYAGFDATVTRKIKAYLEGGGFLFAEACCDGKVRGFDQGFREWIGQMYEGRELTPLAPGIHPVWRVEKAVDEDSVYQNSLWGLNVGCRTSVVYCDRDLSCRWQYSHPQRLVRLQVGADLKQEIQDALAIGLNVVGYATNRELRYKFEQSANLTGDPRQDSVGRGQLFVASVFHHGESQAAPQALPNLQRALAQTKQLRTAPKIFHLPLSDPRIFEFPILVMHGRRSFSFTDKEREQLKKYIERGGFLMADAVCASEEFARSFRTEMKEIFPDRELARIDPDHELFSKKFGGYEIQTVRRREPQPEAERLQALERKVRPQMEGILVGKRYGVIFSPFDISCALENHAAPDCRGYHPEDALKLGVNVVLYSLFQPAE